MRNSRTLIASTAIVAAAAGIFVAAPAQAETRSHDVTASISDGRVFVHQGETYTYDIVLTNHGTEDRSVTVTDTLPSKLAFVSSDDFVAGPDGTFTTDIQVAAGESETVSLTVQASTTQIGNMTNWVAADAHDGRTAWRAWDANSILY